MYRLAIDNLEIKEKQKEFEEEIVRNAEHFPELLNIFGTTKNDAEGRAGAMIVGGWEQLIKTTASKIGKKLIICDSSQLVG